jgi:hypothetical protein
MMTVECANRLAYKDMKTSYYFAGTIIIWAIILLLSSVIGSVTVIFDFASAFAITGTTFIFPGLFYLNGVKKYGGETVYYRRLAKLLLVIGCLNCTLGCCSTVLNIIYG